MTVRLRRNVRIARKDEKKKQCGTVVMAKRDDRSLHIIVQPRVRLRRRTYILLYMTKRDHALPTRAVIPLPFDGKLCNNFRFYTAGNAPGIRGKKKKPLFLHFFFLLLFLLFLLDKRKYTSTLLLSLCDANLDWLIFLLHTSKQHYRVMFSKHFCKFNESHLNPKQWFTFSEKVTTSYII